MEMEKWLLISIADLSVSLYLCKGNEN